MMSVVRSLLLALLFAVLFPVSAATQVSPDLTLTGKMTHEDHRRYRELAFDVPSGVERLAIELDYERGERWAAIDMAVFDPHGFRGGGGFFKTEFVLSASDATPGYLPGPLAPGRWTLVLGGANLPEGAEVDFIVRIRFLDSEATSRPDGGFGSAPLRSGPGWFRGDLHTHTAHSDGSCPSARGVTTPCPVYRTLEAAQAKGLDFLAVTDHNTTAHFAALRELQPHFDDLLIVPGREITTYGGHANVFGPLNFVDFRLGTSSAPDFEAFASAVEAVGGLISINHPGIPEKGGCAGCGWSMDVADYGRAQAVEVVNGVVSRYFDGVEGPASSLPFWHARLNEGVRLTGIGGSDNHDPRLPATELSAIGTPTTVVHAEALSTAAILDGVRAGRVFIDVEGTSDRTLDVSATVDGRTIQMGGTVSADPGRMVRFTVRVVGASGSTLEVIEDGHPVAVLADPIIGDEDNLTSFEHPTGRQRGWLRVNVRAADGRLLLIGNPIYFEPIAGPDLARR